MFSRAKGPLLIPRSFHWKGNGALLPATGAARASVETFLSPPRSALSLFFLPSGNLACRNVPQVQTTSCGHSVACEVSVGSAWRVRRRTKNEGRLGADHREPQRDASCSGDAAPKGVSKSTPSCGVRKTSSRSCRSC
jgi:hypothetical protein